MGRHSGTPVTLGLSPFLEDRTRQTTRGESKWNQVKEQVILGQGGGGYGRSRPSTCSDET